MKKTKLIILLPVFLLPVGCSEMQTKQTPAPVYGDKSPPVAKKPIAKKTAPAKKVAPAQAAPARPSTGTTTYAIDVPNNDFKAVPNVPDFHAEPLPAPAMPNGAIVEQPLNLPPPTFEDVKLPVGSSPAVVALLSESERSIKSGDLDSAVAVMERALRIDPRNPALTYKLAALRLKQSKPQLAEELAGKAALLAGGDAGLKRKSWLLISQARQMQQNLQGAKEAKAKADSFGSQ